MVNVHALDLASRDGTSRFFSMFASDLHNTNNR